MSKQQTSQSQEPISYLEKLARAERARRTRARSTVRNPSPRHGESA